MPGEATKGGLTIAPAGAVVRFVRRPPLRLVALEQRTVLEFWAFMASSPGLRLIGRGDAHPVLVVPGFGAGDDSTRPLRWILRSQGYHVHGWHQGRNQPGPEAFSGLTARLQELHARYGVPVSVVGISLGGVLAREAARQHPDMVRQVITLGSPFRLREGDRGTLSFLFDRAGKAPPRPPGWDQREEDRPPLPVPTTAVYTRTDGFVRWPLCIDQPGPRHENVEVRGSHSGLGHNPGAIYVVSDRLSQPDGQWRPFRPPWGSRRFYPQPAAWHPPLERRPHRTRSLPSVQFNH